MIAQVVRQDRFGDPEQAFQIEEIEVPRLGREVLVAVMAAGINYNNVWAARGDPDRRDRRPASAPASPTTSTSAAATPRASSTPSARRSTASRSATRSSSTTASGTATIPWVARRHATR